MIYSLTALGNLFQSWYQRKYHAQNHTGTQISS